MHEHLSCTLSRLSSSEAVTIIRVSECLPGLHPIHLYWFRTRMTGLPFAASSGGASARPHHHADFVTSADAMIESVMRYPLLALIGRRYLHCECSLSEVKRTWRLRNVGL